MKIFIKMGMVFIFIFLSINIGQFALADEYTRSHEFKPIHIERNELLKTATEIFLYIKKINGDSIDTNGSITLGIDNNSTTIDFPLEQNAYEKFPRISYECSLRIRGYKGVISDLTLRLMDSNKILTVTGTSPEDVTGLIKVVQEKLEFHESYYGGLGFRLLLYIILIIFLGVITYPGWYGKKTIMDRNYIACLVIFCVLLTTISFIPPWAKIFPGFIARIENSSFLEKNSPLFTFVGFLLALLIRLGAFFFRRKRNNIAPEKEADT